MVKRIMNGITYLLLILAVLFLADFYKHPLFLFLPVLLFILIPLSYYTCRYAFRNLSYDVTFPVSYGSSGDSITVSIKLLSHSRFALSNCEITYRISSPFYPCDRIRKVVCPAYAHDTFSFDLPVRFERAGMYEVSILKASAYDYLHLFLFKKEITCNRQITIYPRLISIPDFDKNTYSEGFDEFEETQAKGNVSSNVTDIREYIPGDRLQKIHWKLSRKIDKLMIKENEATATNQFSILVELYLDDPKSDCLEKALRNAYSLAAAMLRSGESFFFIFFSAKRQEFVRNLIRCREDLETALLQCYYESPYESEDLAFHTLEAANLISGVILHATHKGVSDVIS